MWTLYCPQTAKLTIDETWQLAKSKLCLGEFQIHLNIHQVSIIKTCHQEWICILEYIIPINLDENPDHYRIL